MNGLLRDIERNSALLLETSRSLFLTSIPATSTVDLLIVLKEEQNDFDQADRQLTQAIIDELVRRGAYKRTARLVRRQTAKLFRPTG